MFTLFHLDFRMYTACVVQLSKPSCACRETTTCSAASSIQEMYNTHSSISKALDSHPRATRICTYLYIYIYVHIYIYMRMRH